MRDTLGKRSKLTSLCCLLYVLFELDNSRVHIWVLGLGVLYYFVGLNLYDKRSKLCVLKHTCNMSYRSPSRM